MNLVRTTTINPTAFVSTTHHPEWWVLVRLQLNCIRRTRFSVDFVARMAEQWESECRVSAEMNTWNENRAYCRTVDVCDCGYRCHFNLSEISNQLQVATRSKEEDSSQYINSFFSVLFFVVFSECFFFFRFFLFFHFCCNLILKSRLTGVTSINWFYPSTAMATTRCVRFRIFISLVFVHCVFFFLFVFSFAFDPSYLQFVLFVVYCLKHACHCCHCQRGRITGLYFTMSNLWCAPCSQSRRCYYWF